MASMLSLPTPGARWRWALCPLTLLAACSDDAAKVAAVPAQAVGTPIAPPPPPPASPMPPPPAATTAPAPASITGLSVNATFAGRGRGGWVMVTLADGTHKTVGVGQEVVPGVTLVRVAPDRATFASAGTELWLPLMSEAMAKTTPTGATVVAAAPLPSIAPARPDERTVRETLAFQQALAPRVEDGTITGYALKSDAMPPIFRKAGLRPGDVITGVNGRGFNSPQDMTTLSREIDVSATVVFEIRRNGKRSEIQVNPKG